MVVDTAKLAKRDADNLRPGGPFGGVSFLLKDVHPLSGFPMTEGSRLHSSFVAQHDSDLVRRLRNAGFLIIGKTNTLEFSLMPTTEPALHGTTRNPWALQRTAGGSSGGSAAAVTAREEICRCERGQGLAQTRCR
jgi:amidase